MSEILVINERGFSSTQALSTATVVEDNSVFVFEGDSLTKNVCDDTFDGWPVLLLDMEPLASMTITNVNVSAGGNQLSDVVSQYATEVYPQRPAANNGRPAYLFLMIGVNDITTMTVATWLSSWEGYITTAVADGFIVTACTITPETGFTRAQLETLRQVNEGIRDSTVYHYLVDMEQVAQNPVTQTSDGTHQTLAIRGKMANAVLNTLITKRTYRMPDIRSVSDGAGNSIVKSQYITGTSGVQSWMENRSAGSNNKRWVWEAGSTTLTLFAVEDTGTNASSIMVITRSGITLSSIALGAPLAVPTSTTIATITDTSPVLTLRANNSARELNLSILPSGSTYGLEMSYYNGSTYVTPFAMSNAGVPRLGTLTANGYVMTGGGNGALSVRVAASFSAHKNGTDQTVSASTTTKCTFGTEVYDVGGFYASSTWTPPAGKVAMMATLYAYSFLTSDNFTLMIYKNGAEFKRVNTVMVAGQNSINIVVYDDANGTDTYEVYANTAAATTWFGNAAYTYFMGFAY